MGNSCSRPPQVLHGSQPVTLTPLQNGIGRQQAQMGVTPPAYAPAFHQQGQQLQQQQQQQPALPNGRQQEDRLQQATPTTTTTSSSSEHQQALQETTSGLQQAVAVPQQQEAPMQRGGDLDLQSCWEKQGPPLNWTKGKLIGAGAFGRVFQGLDNETGHILAVKQVALTKDEALKGRVAEHIKALEAEVAVLQQLNHRNIVRYLGTERSDDTLNIFLEYVPGGSIASLIEKFGPLKESVIRKYTQQILKGLEYLHQKTIMHRDIKGANILVDPQGAVKLADFGASKKIEDLVTVGSGSKSIRGTPYWMAPEVIKQTGHGRPADIWSMGCVVIEMATGKPPWSNCHTQVAAMFHIASTREPPKLPDHLSPEAKDFLLLCFNRVPKERPNATRLLRHPWMAGLSNPQGLPAAGSASQSVQQGSVNGALHGAARVDVSAPSPIPRGPSPVAGAQPPMQQPAPVQQPQRHPLVPPLQLQQVLTNPPSPIKEESNTARSGQSSLASAPSAPGASALGGGTSQRSSRMQPPSHGALHLPLGIGPLEHGRRQTLMAQTAASLAASSGLPPLHPGSTGACASHAQYTAPPLPPQPTPPPLPSSTSASTPALSSISATSSVPTPQLPAPLLPDPPFASDPPSVPAAQQPASEEPVGPNPSAPHPPTLAAQLALVCASPHAARPPLPIMTPWGEVPIEQIDSIISPSGIPAALLAAAAAKAAKSATTTAAASLPTSTFPVPAALPPPSPVPAAPTPSPPAKAATAPPSVPSLPWEARSSHSSLTPPTLDLRTLDWNPMEEPSWMGGAAGLMLAAAGLESSNSCTAGLPAIQEGGEGSTGGSSAGGEGWGGRATTPGGGQGGSGATSGSSSPGLGYRGRGGVSQKPAALPRPHSSTTVLASAAEVSAPAEAEAVGGEFYGMLAGNLMASGVVVVEVGVGGGAKRARYTSAVRVEEDGGLGGKEGPGGRALAAPLPQLVHPDPVRQSKMQRWHDELVAELEEGRAARALGRSSSGGGASNGGSTAPPVGSAGLSPDSPSEHISLVAAYAFTPTLPTGSAAR